MSKHSEIPWSIVGAAYIWSPKGKCNVAAVGSPRQCSEIKYYRLELGDPDIDEARANAALIVRAVNNHERLLAACREAEGRLTMGNLYPVDVQQLLNTLRAAIAEAEKAT